jgi:hypothetical protein
VRFLFRRKRREAELSEEIQSHLEMAARDRIERGERAEQAKDAANRVRGGNEYAVYADFALPAAGSVLARIDFTRSAAEAPSRDRP